MTVVLILLTAVVAVFFILGRYSARQQPLGMSGEQGFSCGTKPNCVTTLGVVMPSQAIEYLDLKGLGNAAESLLDAVRATGGVVIESGPVLISAVYKSRLFGFVDDVMIKLDESGQRADVISRSRIGYSDFGANRKRVEAIRAALKN